METGSNKGLFTLIAIVVFGIFLSLSYFLFKDELVGVLADVMYSTSEMTSQKLDHDGLIPTDESYFSVTTNANGTTCTLTDFKIDATSPTELIIPATIDGLTVTNIAGGAFYNKGLTSIIFPSTVTKIDNYIGERGAFQGNNLKELVIPPTITEIGVRAFKDCNIEKLTLSNGLVRIGSDAFHNNKLKEVLIPDTVKYIDWHSFGSNQLTSVILGKSVEYIGPIAFNNNQIKEITLPTSIKQVEYLWLFNNPVAVINAPSTFSSFVDANPNSYSKTGVYNTVEKKYYITEFYDKSIYKYY